MKRLHLIAMLGVACACALLVAAPAAAAISCVYTSGNHKVTVTYDPVNPNNETVLIARSGNAIFVNFAPCGGATVFNTNTIAVTGGPGRQHLSVNLAGGPYEPGFTPEGGGVSEIEIQVDLKAGTDSLAIQGSLGDDNLTIGTNGVNLNGDGDGDLITPTEPEEWSVSGDDGLDTISAAGGPGAGAALEDRIFITGGDGNDAVTGGDGTDQLSGDNDADTVTGGAGDDFMSGGPGVDSLDGGLDQDFMTGEQGNDTFDGGPGDDAFLASADPDGNDIFIGGGGRDFVDYNIRGTAALDVDLDGLANDGRVGSEFDNVNQDVESVRGSKGPNVLTGSAEDNSLDGREGADTLNGLGGNDNLSGEGDPDTLNGGGSNDFLNAGDGADHLNGQDGNDNMFGGAGNDVQTGGTGVDFFSSRSRGRRSRRHVGRSRKRFHLVLLADRRPHDHDGWEQQRRSAGRTGQRAPRHRAAASRVRE